MTDKPTLLNSSGLTPTVVPEPINVQWTPVSPNTFQFVFSRNGKPFGGMTLSARSPTDAIAIFQALGSVLPQVLGVGLVRAPEGALHRLPPVKGKT